MDLIELINQDGATIVDVREIHEYNTGHIEGAINIPLGTVPQRVEDFKNMSKPIIVHCASGMRSAQAVGFLTAQGVSEVYNGGGIHTVMHYQNQTV